jgi:hypothetical protein
MLGSFALMPSALADGIVAKVVSSPLSATGTVQGAHVGINVYLQSESAKGIDFMDPNVVGYGIADGGRVEIEMAVGFERVGDIPLTQKTIMVVTGAPQQGMPGKAVGYTVGEGANKNTFTITAAKEGGLPAETLLSPAKGAKGDPVRQRGIKVFHIGFLQSPFINKGSSGTVNVRFIDGAGKTTHSGSATIDFLTASVPQIHPNNLPNAQRNHNWQVATSGQVLGKDPGTVPIPIMLYEPATGVAAAELVKFKKGIVGAGVLSTQQLAAIKFEKPAALARYNGGLIVRDTNGDRRLDPKVDQIIGGVIGSAPTGAKGQELRSLDSHGATDLSRPTTAYHPGIGKLFGGAVGLLQFTAGDKPGLYRPTLALLSDPDNQSSPDGASYTYTVVVK